MTLTVEQARERGLCRICGQVVRFLNLYTGHWEYVPKNITFNFGREYAHTECLEEAVQKVYADPYRYSS